MLAHYLHLGVIDYWNEIGFNGIQQQKKLEDTKYTKGGLIVAYSQSKCGRYMI